MINELTKEDLLKTVAMLEANLIDKTYYLKACYEASKKIVARNYG
ncbi:hypothetical protein IGI37_002116 [Enterococcus sp. AZ194]